MVHESQFASHPAVPPVAGSVGGAKLQDGEASFAEVLSDNSVKTEGVTFSAHASRRLAQREIALSDRALDRIAEATDKAAMKGSRESLLLLDNLGLIVNVRNRTVLTAIDPDRMREGIVTNIDSTVIIGTE